jgi:hypothetical protein
MTPARVEKDILGFEITVSEPRGMGGDESLGHLDP